MSDWRGQYCNLAMSGLAVLQSKFDFFCAITLAAISPANATPSEEISVAGNSGYLFKPNIGTAKNAILPCANLGATRTINVSTLVSEQAAFCNILATNSGLSSANKLFLKTR